MLEMLMASLKKFSSSCLDHMRYYFGAVAYFSYPVSTANKKTAGKLARSVAVGKRQMIRQAARINGALLLLYHYLRILEISYVSLRIDK